MSNGTEVNPSALAFLQNQEKAKSAEKVQYYTNEYINANMANTEDRERCEASNNLYIGIDNKQWTSKALEYLNSMERAAHTYNLAKISVDKVVGQIIQNPHAIKFAAINQEQTATANIEDSLYEYDNDRGSFDKEWHRFVKDTVIHTGVMEMYVDYRHSRLGNISRRALNRVTEIEFDPNWKSADIEDCRMIYKYTWKTAREIKDTWNKKSGEIDNAINRYETISGTGDVDPNDLMSIANRTPNFVDQNGRYKVIEVSYMQKVEKKKKNADKIAKFDKENSNPDLVIGQDNSPIVAPEYISVCKVLTFAPGVGTGLVLQEGDHPVQIGRLPYSVASADLTMGYRQGLITGMIDAQVSLNKKISMQTGNQISSANGALLFDEDLFRNEAEADKFTRERTKTGATFKTSSGINIAGAISPVPTAPMPPDLQASIDWHQKFLSLYANDTDAMSGRSGGANESGVLFESKKNQSQVAHVGLVSTLEQVKREDANGYFLLSKTVYSGPHREMRSATSGDKIDINKRVSPVAVEANLNKTPNATVNYYLAGVDGEMISAEPGNATFAVLNEISSLPRHDVIIKKSELGLDQKQHTLSLFSEMSQRGKNPISQTIYEAGMAPLLEVNKDISEKLRLSGEIFFEFQMEQMKGNIIAIKAQNAQAALTVAQSELQLQQMQQPQQPPQPGQPQEDPTQNAVGDSRTAANMAGGGNLAEAIASDSSGANNQAASDT